MELFIVPVAHVSEESKRGVKEAVERFKPDVVAVELDAQRFSALHSEKGPSAADMIRKPFFALLYLAQRFAGKALGIAPGSEMLAAVNAARDANIPVAFVDRPIGITMQRMSAVSLREKLTLALQAILIPLAFISIPFSPGKKGKRAGIDQMVNDPELLGVALTEFKSKLPITYRVLVEERDEYIFRRVVELNANRIVLVVGAGHVKGITKRLEKLNHGLEAGKDAGKMANEFGGAAS